MLRPALLNKTLSVALIAAAALWWMAPRSAVAKEAAPAAEDPVLEARLQAIAVELRCLVCQNQTIADSNADLAVDLRNQVRDMLRQGKSERDIIDFMTERYGDFVLYRPPVKGSTALLWFGPGVFMVGGVFILWWVLRRRAQRAPEDFEPDEPDALADDDRPAPPATHTP